MFARARARGRSRSHTPMHKRTCKHTRAHARTHSHAHACTALAHSCTQAHTARVQKHAHKHTRSHTHTHARALARALTRTHNTCLCDKVCGAQSYEFLPRVVLPARDATEDGKLHAQDVLPNGLNCICAALLLWIGCVGVIERWQAGHASGRACSVASSAWAAGVRLIMKMTIALVSV